MSKSVKRVVSLNLCIVILLSVFSFSLMSNAAYENTYTNTGNQRADIIGVAQTQVGYVEGSNNNNKYGSYFSGNNTSWCAYFVVWCARQAGINSSVIKLSGYADADDLGVAYRGRPADRSSGINYTPQSGDIIFFDWSSNGYCYNSPASSYGDHVGLVEYVADGYVHTIEGNSNDAVRRNTYPLSSNEIKGYGLPNYQDSTTSPTYADLGDDFYAVILNKACWKPISQVSDTNHIYLQTEDNSARQRWHFVRQDDGAYTIASCYDGKALQMAESPREVCNPVFAEYELGGPWYCQQWYLIPFNGGYIFQNKHYTSEDWVMDLYGGYTDDGTPIQINHRNKNDAQTWSIYKGDEVQLRAPSLNITVASPKATFTWDSVYGATHYDLKIWKDAACVNELYHIEWSANSGFSMEFPAGTYYAYVCACDYFQFFGSANVKFVVPNKTYTVAYNANGGSNAPSSQTKNACVDLTLSTTKPTKTTTITLNANGGSVSPTSKTVNSTFKRWNTEANGSGTEYSSGGTYKDNASVTLYAQWNDPAGYTLPAPTRTGYACTGWNTKADGTGTNYAVGSNYVAKTSISLYAQWSPITYSVKFNGNGATSGSMSNQAFTYDVAQNLTANAFQRKYTVTYNYNYSGSTNTTATATYTFSNWNKKADGSDTSYTDGKSVKNLTATNGATVNLYAQWTGGTVTLPTPTRTGYTFAGWNTKADGTGTNYAAGASYKPTEPTTLYARWTANTYTISYNANGAASGTAPSNQTKTHGTALTLAKNTGSLAKMGYTLDGWATEPDGTKVYNLGGSYTANEGATLYAHWLPYKVPVIYRNPQQETLTAVSPTYTAVNNQTAGTLTWSCTTDGVFTLDGSTTVSQNITGIQLPATAAGEVYKVTITKIGGSFTGGNVMVELSEDGENRLQGMLQSGQSISSDRQMTQITTGDSSSKFWAIYKTKNNILPRYIYLWVYCPSNSTVTADNYQFKITVQKVSGATSRIATYDTALGTLPTLSTRTGYDLKGWFTSASSGTQVNASTVFTGTVVTSYFAQWTPHTYSVKFNGNGSTSGSMSNQAFTYDVAQNLTANAFKRAYTVTYNYNYSGSTNTKATATYTFSNWNKKADGSETSYTDGESVKNLTATNDATVNLYAQWTGGTVTLPTPTRTGYTFAGWNTKADGTGTNYAAGASYKPTANSPLYAKWIANTPVVNPTVGSGAVVDESTHLIYGLSAGETQGFVAVTDGTAAYGYPTAKQVMGTGTKVYIFNNDQQLVNNYTVVIFGDVNGDGWYDGTDAYFVRLAASGMIPAAALTEAQRAAADCNHDGTVDNADVALLEQAGLLLANVDQTLPSEELQTDSIYLEYCSLIEQTVEIIEPEQPADDQPAQTAEPQPAAPSVWGWIKTLFTIVLNWLLRVF